MSNRLHSRPLHLNRRDLSDIFSSLTGVVGSLTSQDGSSSTSDAASSSEIFPTSIPSIPLSLPHPHRSSSTLSSTSDPSDTNSATNANSTSSSSSSLTSLSDSTSRATTSQPNNNSAASTPPSGNPNSPTNSPAQDHNATASPTDITSTYTSISGTVTATYTTVIHPSGSLAAAPDGSPLFRNKAEEAITFTLVALAGVALFSFLGYRFYKTVKRAQERREIETEAMSARYRTRIDDEDEDGSPPYGGQMSEAQIVGSHFDLLRADPTPLDGASDSGSSRSEFLIRRRMPGTGPDLSPSPEPSLYNGSSQGHTTRPSTDLQHSLAHESVGGSHQTHRSVDRLRRNASNKSQSTFLALESLPPPIVLPDSFGEDVPTRPITPVEDDEDYQGSVGRVLKVTNE